jgi:hypothetical protein
VCPACESQTCVQLLPRIVEQIRNKVPTIREQNMTSVLVDELTNNGEATVTMSPASESADVAFRPEVPVTAASLIDAAPERRHTCELSYSGDGCVYSFQVRYTRSESLHVSVLRHRKCPEPLSVKQALSQLSIGFLTIGVLTLLIWRLITYCFDKREYEQFLRQVKNAQWEEVTFDRSFLYCFCSKCVPN